MENDNKGLKKKFIVKGGTAVVRCPAVLVQFAREIKRQFEGLEKNTKGEREITLAGAIWLSIVKDDLREKLIEYGSKVPKWNLLKKEIKIVLDKGDIDD